MISVSQLFISNAYAEGAGTQEPTLMGQLMFFIPLILVFYFLIIRPQQKRAKEHQTMVSALQKGDEVVTIGGILGKVTKVGEENIGVEIGENMVVQVQKAAIQNVLPKGTIKSL